MADPDPLQAEEKIVEASIVTHADEISLDQPFPDEITMPTPPTNPVTTPEGQTEEPAKEQKEPATAAGYSAGDIATALVKPPEPVITETKKAVKNPHVKFLVGIGVAFALIGILLIVLVDSILGGVVMVFGVLFVIAAVFLPVHKLFKPKKPAK